MEGWAAFTEDMQQFYGLDLTCLSQVPLSCPVTFSSANGSVPRREYMIAYCASLRAQPCCRRPSFMAALLTAQLYRDEQRNSYIAMAACCNAVALER